MRDELHRPKRDGTDRSDGRRHGFCRLRPHRYPLVAVRVPPKTNVVPGTELTLLLDEAMERAVAGASQREVREVVARIMRIKLSAFLFLVQEHMEGREYAAQRDERTARMKSLRDLRGTVKGWLNIPAGVPELLDASTFVFHDENDETLGEPRYTSTPVKGDDDKKGGATLSSPLKGAELSS